MTQQNRHLHVCCIMTFPTSFANLNHIKCKNQFNPIYTLLSFHCSAAVFKIGMKQWCPIKCTSFLSNQENSVPQWAGETWQLGDHTLKVQGLSPPYNG